MKSGSGWIHRALDFRSGYRNPGTRDGMPDQAEDKEFEADSARFGVYS
jgi:hypothetical protein